MSELTLCLIHEDIGRQSAIARIAQWAVEHALAAGWKVTVVAQQLDESLQGRVEWLKLYKPKRMFLFQWMVARPAVQSAIGGRKFDVVHAHQAQINALADLQQCHFLTRVAWERNCLESGMSARSRFVRAQQLCVMRAEDHYYRHKNPTTRLVFCSDLLRCEFKRLYGLPLRAETLQPAVPPMNLPTVAERERARLRWVPEVGQRIVVGYLGGIDERKGFRRLFGALQQDRDPDLFLLLAGPHTQGYTLPQLEGRYRAVGLVEDTNSFYAACDVVVMPSLFEPLGLVVFEAAARGVPSISTTGVGALPTLRRYEAGVEWRAEEPLAPRVREAVARRDEFLTAWHRMATDLSEQHQAMRLLQIYAEIVGEKRLHAGSGSPTT